MSTLICACLALASSGAEWPVVQATARPVERAAPLAGAPVIQAAQAKRVEKRRLHRKARGRSPVRPALAGVAAATRSAIREPSALAFVNAVQIYPWSEGALYRLYGAPERITDIALEAGEALVSIAAGDTARWTVGDTTSGAGETRRTHILVKPFVAGLKTNLFITTDRRSYHLQLESTASTAMSAISWTYPADLVVRARSRQGEAASSSRPTQAIPLESLRFGYAISGDRPSWRPLRAFDDGRQVYVEFPASLSQGEAPPLFVVGHRGEPQLVNYRVTGNFYVVDRLFDVAELRLGTRKQQIVRIERQAARAGRGRSGS